MSGIGLIALVGLDLSRNEGEHLRDDGQVLRVEASDAISFGQGRLYQMPECPSYVVAVTGEVTFLSFRCSYDTGNLSCHGWLFCYDCFHCLFSFRFTILLLDLVVVGITSSRPCFAWTVSVLPASAPVSVSCRQVQSVLASKALLRA